MKLFLRTVERCREIGLKGELGSFAQTKARDRRLHLADGTGNQRKKMDFKNILDIQLLFHTVTLDCFHRCHVPWPAEDTRLDQPLQPLAMKVLNLEFKDSQE